MDTHHHLRTRHPHPRCMLPWVVFAALLWPGMSGCGEDRRGTIVVDRPEVFTRERLVSRRVTEVEWLQGKLDAPFTPTLQGYNDTREFTGVISAIEGTFDPLGGKLTAGRQVADLADLQREQRENELNHRIEVRKLKKQLEDAQNPPETGGEGEGGGDTGTPTDDQQQGGQANEEEDKDEKEDPPATSPPAFPSATDLGAFKAEGGNAPRVISAADVVETKAKLTAVESLRDEMAYRDAIQASLRERELDDTHDLRGYTLYTLKFDVTVRPGRENDALGRVRLSLEPGGSSLPRQKPTLGEVLDWRADNKRTPRGFDQKAMSEAWRQWSETYLLYRSWKTAFEREVQLEALALQRRAAARQVSEAEFLSIARSAAQYVERQQVATSETPGKVRDSIAAQNRSVQMLLKSAAPVPRPGPAAADPGQKADAAKGAALVVRGRYLPLEEEGIVAFAPDLQELTLESGPGASAVGERVYLPTIVAGDPRSLDVADQTPNLCRFEKFVDLLRRLQRRQEARYRLRPDKGVKTKEGSGRVLNAAYVYTVEPKEYAQNLSDVAAAEKLNQFILSLRAVLPQFGVNGGAYLNSMRDSQSRLHAIMRKPLVVGFANGPQEFGWLFGPRFKIDGGDVGFEQSLVQHSLQATVAVPAWERSLTLTGNYRWGARGEKPLWKDWGKYDRGVIVELPADPAALTRALVSILEISESHQPNIFPSSGGIPEKIVLYGGRRVRPQQVLIRGTDLWRNPSVFVGSQKADKLEVLPDMTGLLATFNELQVPATVRQSAAVDVDLTVVTSGGVSTRRHAVTIVAAAGAGGTSDGTDVAARLLSTYVVGQNPILFSLEDVPERHGGLFVRTRTADAANWNPLSAEPAVINPANNRAAFKPAAAPGQPTETAVEIRMRSTPGADPGPNLLNGRDTFAHYPDEKSRQARLDDAHKTITFEGPADAAPKDLSVVSAKTLSIALPPLAEIAYPGLTEAIRAKGAKLALNTYRLSIAPGATASAVTADPRELVEVDTNSAAFPGKLPDGTTEEKQTVNAPHIEYKTAAGELATVPVSVDGAVTVVRKKK